MWQWARRVEVETGLRAVSWREQEQDFGAWLQITVVGITADATVWFRERFRTGWGRDRAEAYEIRDAMRRRIKAALSGVGAIPPGSVCEVSEEAYLLQSDGGLRRLGMSPRDAYWSDPREVLPPSDLGIDGAVPLPQVDPEDSALLGRPDERAWAELNRRINDAINRPQGG